MRRLLLRNRLFGIKVGPVWAIFPNDLEAFKRMRRPPGRPRKAKRSALDRAVARAAPSVFEPAPIACDSGSGGNPNALEPLRSRVRPASAIRSSNTAVRHGVRR